MRTKEAEMLRAATARAKEAIAEIAAARTTESARIKELAEATIIDRLQRSHITGCTKKGRIITEMIGEASAAELELRKFRR